MSRLAELKEAVSDRKRILVLYSGGLDSTLLTRVAYDVLGRNAVALTFDSPIVPRHEIAQAKNMARNIGIKHVLFPLNEIEQGEHFAENPPDRCYICRKLRNSAVKIWAKEHGFETVADGTNFSDYEDYRPGMKASLEDKIWQPFIDVQITKDEIRQFSKELGLPGWDKPNTVCLCSRFPYGYQLIKEQLSRVEAAEEYLRGMGFAGFRIRCFPYEMAVIELSEPVIALQYKEDIVAALKGLGFTFVALDLEGFFSGKMNRIITQQDRN
ncbi:MAG TPA: ATP-dependent sacrificial sulfur transferase LarE [Deltaproteobacteria bacterium]|nr:ATP-dependent sacrificial sulfur transferase LarE [Deltaproteobacteria bacterium]